MAHNPITLIPALGGSGRRISVSSRPAWSTKWVPGQPELYRETLSLKRWGGGNSVLMITKTCNRATPFPFSAKNLVQVDGSRGDGSVLLTCGLTDKTIKWLKDGSIISPLNATKNTWNLGNNAKDPRGTYQCQGAKETSNPLQVYYRSM
jgi:hypothetical protein